MAERRTSPARAARRETAWWRGRRGEWYVITQFVLFALVAAGPATWRGWPPWRFPGGRVTEVIGAAMMVTGLALALWAGLKHGAALQALPYPRQDGTVIHSGPYRIVRHPIYSGALSAALGWALFRHGWLTLVYAALLFLLFDAKARREEEWLTEKSPSYAEYRRRVRKFVPCVY